MEDHQYFMAVGLKALKMKKSFCSLLVLTACILITGCSSDQEEIKLDANRDLVRNFHRVWSGGKVMELEGRFAGDSALWVRREWK